VILQFLYSLGDFLNYTTSVDAFCIIIQNKGEKVMNIEQMIKKIEASAKQRGVSRTKLLQDCGVRSYVDNLKKGRLPKVDTISKIADYLNVSVDYLLGRTENPEVNK
jgi:hypothetical protein